MPRGVLDTGVLISAVLNPTAAGASFDLLRFAREGRFELHLSPGIIEETARVLLTRKRIRDRYHYSDARLELARGGRVALSRHGARSGGRAQGIRAPPRIPAVRGGLSDGAG
jgi:hypothetical protein